MNPADAATWRHLSCARSPEQELKLCPSRCTRQRGLANGLFCPRPRRLPPRWRTGNLRAAAS
eukprot:876862-Pyramimonas_sp.AAC.1